MAQQTLQTIISLSGHVDNSFGQIGESLINLGSQIDGISQKIIDFGKESVKTYVSYDDAMRETQAVGGYTEAQMEKLDELNREIARTTTYTNLESANAMVLIAQAGLDVNETYALLPETLKLAMAGNLELADSVDYLMTSLTSMGYGMDYAETLTDQMAKTASIGMTDIDTLGDSLMRLGSASGEFFTSSEEILTILSAMSQFGNDMRGSEAGTWLRNFMLSLAAPAGDIDTIILALRQLGIAEDELEAFREAHDDGIATGEVNDLKDMGLKIYDDAGNLLPAIEIIKSLRDTVRGSAEYSNDLTELTGALNQAGGDIDAFLAHTEGMTDNALYNTFAKIFGKRGITTAMNLISISDEEWEQTMAAIVNSDGFAQGMADTMQGGPGGALRELEAAYTEFQTTIGEELAPAVQSVASGLKEIVTGLSEMDEDKMDALVSGATVLAGAGPALLLTGGAFRLIGNLITPTGAIGLGLAGLTSAAIALKEISEGKMLANFGDMELDAESLGAYISSLGEDFNAAYEDVNRFNAALETSVTDYTTASQTFSSDLMTAMLTGTTLTPEAQAKLESLGTDMYTALVSGINNSTAATMSYFEMLFGGEGAAEYDPQYQQIISLTNQSYLDALATAESLSQGLRDALTSAFDDGKVSQEEYAEIQSWMQSYNDAMAQAAAEAQREEDYVKAQMLFHKAQTASYDEIKGIAGEVQTERDALLAAAEEEYLKERFGLEYRYNQAIQNGTMVDGRYVTEADRDAALEAVDARYAQHVTEQSAMYDGILTRLWETSIDQSDLGTAYDELGALADRFMTGELSAESAVKAFKDAYGSNAYAGEADFMADNTRTQLGEYLARMIASYGGYEGLTAKADYYDSIGDAESAATLRRLYAMQQINDNFAETGVINYDGVLETLFGDGAIFSSSAGEYAIMQQGKDAFNAYMQDYIADYTLETAQRTVDAYSGGIGGMDNFFAEIGKGKSANDVSGAWSDMSKTARSEYSRMVELLAAIYDFEKVLADETNMFAQEESVFRDDAAVYSLLYGNASQNPEQYRITAEVDPVIEAGAVDEAAGEQTITAPVVTEDAANAASAAQEDMQAAMDDPLKQGVTVSDNGSAATTRSYMEGVFSDPITQYIRTGYIGGLPGSSKMTLYAEGGRATEASIFGDAGPEWAIPEAHTARTASLLEQAAEASGFSWPSLSDAGSGSASDSGTKQLIYSPTIIANDASGVDQKLREDKDRLDKWFRDKQLRDDVEVYA